MLSAATIAQETTCESSSWFVRNNVLNHMDVGVNVGTVGIGVEVSVPVTDFVRVRAGYNYMPRFTLHSDFPIETRSGGIGNYLEKLSSIDIDQKMSEAGVDLSLPKFQKYKEMADEFRGVTPKDYVTMDMQPKLHQFKFLVDVMPFKNNRHWSFTAGFFAGPSTVGKAFSQESETLLLKAVTAYNSLYVDYLSNDRRLPETTITVDRLTQLFEDNGVAGIPLGYFSGGKYDGRKAMMVPKKDGSVRAEMEISKVRPYLGVGYNTHLSRDKRWNLNVDAGVLFLCGKPKVYVNNVYAIDENAPKEYEVTIVPEKTIFGVTIPAVTEMKPSYDIVHLNYLNYDFTKTSDEQTEKMYYVDGTRSKVDLMRDLRDIPGKVGDMVDKISKLKVYPNISVTVSYRLY